MPIEKSEKDKKAEAKVIDAEDESFCGFISLQVVDDDGIQKLTKGSAIGGPLHHTKVAGGVELTAEWPLNPLYYLEMQRDDKLFLFGDVWYGEQKRTPLNALGRVVPRTTKALVDEMEKNSGETCEMKLAMPFLKGNKSVPVKITTKEQKFVTKVVKATICISDADWAEWKQYRLNFWKVSKAWGGSGGEDEKEDKDKKKEEKDE